MFMTVTGPPAIRAQDIISREERQLSGESVIHCGQLLSVGTDILSGHGTISTGDKLFASVSGVRMQYNRLLQVEPYKSKYIPKVGDVVVGRIVCIRKARWKVDVNHRLTAVLHVNNVNLPGGELRHKGPKDEVAMSKHLVVGDLVMAEVQQVRMRGQVQLHTRSLKYGKLGQGLMIRAPASSLKPQKDHVLEIDGVSVIIGCNGIIWISPSIGTISDGHFIPLVPPARRSALVRTAACIRLLVKSLVSIYDVTIMCAYSASLAYRVKELAHPKISSFLMPRIVEMTKAEEKQRALEKDQREAAGKRRGM